MYSKYSYIHIYWESRNWKKQQRNEKNIRRPPRGTAISHNRQKTAFMNIAIQLWHFTWNGGLYIGMVCQRPWLNLFLILNPVFEINLWIKLTVYLCKEEFDQTPLMSRCYFWWNRGICPQQQMQCDSEIKWNYSSLLMRTLEERFHDLNSFTFFWFFPFQCLLKVAVARTLRVNNWPSWRIASVVKLSSLRWDTRLKIFHSKQKPTHCTSDRDKRS